MNKSVSINSLSAIILVFIVVAFGWANFKNVSQIQTQRDWQTHLQLIPVYVSVYDHLIAEEQYSNAMFYLENRTLKELIDVQDRVDHQLFVLRKKGFWPDIASTLYEDLKYLRGSYVSCLVAEDDCFDQNDQVVLSVEELEILMVNELRASTRLSGFDNTINELYQFFVQLTTWNANFQLLTSSLELYSQAPSAELKAKILRYIFLLSKSSIYIQANATLLEAIPNLSGSILDFAQNFSRIQQLALPAYEADSLQPLLFDKTELYQITTDAKLLRSNVYQSLEELSDQQFQEIEQQMALEFLISLVILFLMLASIIVIRRNAVLPLEQNQAILNNAPIGILQIDSRGRIKSINAGALEMFAQKLENVMGQSITILLPPQARKLIVDALQNYTDGGEAVFIGKARELYGLKGSGAVFPMEVTTTEIRVGNASNFILLASDLTQKLEAKQQTERNNRLLAILKSSTENTVANDFANIEVWQLLLKDVTQLIDAEFGFMAEVCWKSSVKPSAAITLLATTKGIHSPGHSILLGYESQFLELIAKHPYVTASRHPQVTALFDEVYPKPSKLEKVLLPIFKAREVVGFYGFMVPSESIQDILQFLEPFKTTCSVLFAHEENQNAQKTLVEQLNLQTKEAMRAQELAEQAAAAKTLFLANMSHEIRTPMNAVLGLSHLLGETDLQSTQKDYVRKIQKAGSSLMGIINDILDFSKIESGNLQLEKQPFELESLVLNQVELLVSAVKSNHVELLLNYDAPEFEGNTRLLMGDSLRLEQVLTNLLSNAVKFTSDGYVMLSVTGEPAGQNARFTFKVIDSGIGISETAQKTLFQKFTQADESTTRKYGGTGLGLAISQQLVQLMGGEIQINSQPEMGSEFSFSLEFAVQVQPKHKEILDIAGQKALVLDDNVIAAGILSSYLTHKHCHTLVVETLDETVSALTGGVNFDWLFLDWHLQAGDCQPILQKLYDEQPEMLAKTFVVTATSDKSKQDAAKHFGLAGVLQKPISPSWMLEAMRKSLLEEHEIEVEQVQNEVNLTNLNVLLVEDNKLNQQIALEMLRSKGAEVLLAENGLAAIEMLNAQAASAFDVVLMDLQMPVMGGHEATERLRMDERYNDLPIVAMTAHAMQEEIERCMNLGMNDYITKPIDLQRLYAVLSKILEHKNQS